MSGPDFSLLDLASRGGPVMWPIYAVSIGALALALDRIVYLLSHRDDPVALESLLQKADRTTFASVAAELAAHPRSPVAALWNRGLLAWPAGREEAERAMHSEGIRQIARAERGLSVLSALITLLPMLGFLGTITGLIQSFMQWEAQGADVQITALAGGIYEAMITTAAGLSFAIPYYAAYSLIADRIGALSRRLDLAHDTLLHYLTRDEIATSPAAPPADPPSPTISSPHL